MNVATKCVVTTALASGLSTGAFAQGNAETARAVVASPRQRRPTPDANGETGATGGPTGKHSTLHLKRHHKPKNHS